MIIFESYLKFQLLVKILGRFGYQDIAKANDGLEAINAIRCAQESGNPIQLVFMDMEMPVSASFASFLVIINFCRTLMDVGLAS